MSRSLLTSFAGIFLLIACVASIRGEDQARLPPPAPPLIQPPPEKAHWTLTVQEPQPDAQAHPSPGASAAPLPPRLKLVSIDIVKTGEIKRDIRTFGDGHVTEVWFNKSIYLFPDSNGQPAVSDLKAVVGLSLLRDPIRSAGYTGIGWIDLRYYDRVVVFNGRPAYHYHMASASQALPASVGKNQTQSQTTLDAWIDAKTGVPLGYTDPRGRMFTYAFSTPPSASLVLPPSYASVLKTFLAYREK